jgi:hypothetical protein
MVGEASGLGMGLTSTPWRRPYDIVFKAVLILLIVSAMNVGGAARASSVIRGVVQDEQGNPLSGSTVYLWEEGRTVGSAVTGPDGLFEFEVEADTVYTLYAFADDERPGYEYLPSRSELTASGVDEVLMTLAPAASLVMEGDIQFVAAEDLPSSVLYSLIDPSSGEVLEINGFPLVYGSGPESQSPFVGLEGNHIVVPAGEPFKIGVNFSVLVRSDIIMRSFEIDEPFLSSLQAGEQIQLDVREYSIPHNIEFLESLLGTVADELDDLDSLGFYIATERKVTDTAAKLISDASFFMGGSQYPNSYDACKKGYLELFQTHSRLTSMVNDAKLSVHSIIVFLAFASTTIAFLLSNRDSTKVLGSIGVYAATLAILYFAYPGSVIVPVERFGVTGVIAISFSLVVAMVFPRFMKGRGGNGHLPVRNIVVPIFSMAKRSIRRRKLRFALTLVSITVLVMSFVSLTSFSQGYGLLVRRVSMHGSPREGVLIRDQSYTEMEPTSLSQLDLASGWLERQPESAVVSAKAENFPLPRPTVSLNELPVYGVMGIEPSLEGSVMPLADALIEGELPSEDGIVITESLKESLSVGLGDVLSLSGVKVELVGVLDDVAPGKLKDLDGSNYLPKKMVNLNPGGEVPQYVVRPCEPTEYVIVHVSTALRMALVGISRVAITVKGGVDVNAFAERLALERGYSAYSASVDGVYIARLGGYVEGKGLPLMVLWVIVVLNVVITMLNSMFERRREIHILSSVGLNPAQIAAIFVAEASILGLTAGGLGYLGGLGVYKGMAIAGLSLEVRQKVSAFWSLASIGIAMTAVLMGAFASLKSSVVITPSLMMRWRIEDQRGGFEAVEMPIPVRLLREEVDGFVAYVVSALKDLEDDPVKNTSSIKVFDAEVEDVRIEFIYKAPTSTVGNFYTRNSIHIERDGEDGEVGVRLSTYGDQEWAHTTGSLVRMIAMRWSTSQERIELARRS